MRINDLSGHYIDQRSIYLMQLRQERLLFRHNCVTFIIYAAALQLESALIAFYCILDQFPLFPSAPTQ